MACAVAGVTVALACNVQAQAPEATVASPGLPPVHVNAGHKNANTEGTASYTTNSMNTASKLALPIRDTPQSVSVITRQHMDDQGMTNLNDVVKYTPGLILQNTVVNGNVFSRAASRSTTSCTTACRPAFPPTRKT